MILELGGRVDMREDDESVSFECGKSLWRFPKGRAWTPEEQRTFDRLRKAWESSR